MDICGANGETGRKPTSRHCGEAGGRRGNPERCGAARFFGSPRLRLATTTNGGRVLLATLLCLVALLLALAPEPARAAHDRSERSDGPATSFRGLNPPREPPFFEVRDADGQVLGLDAFRGRVMLLNLWATWCIPCIREMPALDRLQAKFGKADFVVVPLSLDKEGRPKVEAFYKRHELQNLDIYLDPELTIEQGFPIDVLPANFLFDRQGRVAGYIQNYVDWDAPEAEAMIRGLVETGTMGE